jgi:dihydroorotase-like cyclic amidohydrolase
VSDLDLFIRNARAVMGDQTIWCDIGISKGRISSITPWGSDPPASRKVVDADGCWVIPGAIDTHAHIGQVAPEYETREGLDSEANFLWESRAALSGGVTTALNYLKFSQGSMLDMLRRQRVSAEKHCLIDVLFHGYIMNDLHQREIEAAVRSGIRSFKIFLPYRGEEARSLGGISSLNYGKLQLAMRKLSSLGAQALVHAEDGDIVEISTRQLVSHGDGTLADWEASRPTAAEGTASLAALYLARRERCRVTIVHVSSSEAVAARNALPDVDVTLESCPHYLALCVEDGLGATGKVAPPIRHRAEVEALWEAVEKGAISFFGSDHNVWPQDAKCTVWTAKAGLPGIDLMLPLLLTKACAERGMPIHKVVELVSTNAARRFGIYPKKGAIQVGADADLVVLDVGSKKVAAVESPSAVDYSPYEGTVLKIWPRVTIRAGVVAYDGGKFDEDLPACSILNDNFATAVDTNGQRL